jgi:hypothetical protein
VELNASCATNLKTASKRPAIGHANQLQHCRHGITTLPDAGTIPPSRYSVKQKGRAFLPSLFYLIGLAASLSHYPARVAFFPYFFVVNEHWYAFEAGCPGLITTIGPGNPSFSTLPFTVIWLYVLPTCVPPNTSALFGATPPIVTVAPCAKFVPPISISHVPAAFFCSALQLVTTAASLVGVVVLPPSHVTVTITPCSLPCVVVGVVPAGHPGHAVPAGKFRLVPVGPLTKIKNVWPAFADPKLKNASISVELIIANVCAGTTAPVASSTANTDVTFTVPFGRMKQLPGIVISCPAEQSISDGVADITTGALCPKSNPHENDSWNPPLDSRLKMLLFPAENVVVVVNVASPPQHAVGTIGNPVPGDCDVGLMHPCTRFPFTGVTFVRLITTSGVSSPVAHDSVIVVVTVFPGRVSGAPVLCSGVEQIVVVSFGIIPQATLFNCTAQIALIIPAVGVATCFPLPFGVAAAAVPTAGSPGGTGTGVVGRISAPNDEGDVQDGAGGK